MRYPSEIEQGEAPAGLMDVVPLAMTLYDGDDGDLTSWRLILAPPEEEEVRVTLRCCGEPPVVANAEVVETVRESGWEVVSLTSDAEEDGWVSLTVEVRLCGEG